jgi:hypothetical protein
MSLLWPDVEEAAGRESAIRRGFWGGVIITLMTAAGPPPLGALSLITFGLITLGIHLRQTWAARAGVLAAYAPLLQAAQQPDRALVMGAFVQCSILAYFFFNAWRGLRAQRTLLERAGAIGWLALSMAFIAAWYYGGGVLRVPDDSMKPELQAGDTIWLRPAETKPKTGDIVLMQSTVATEPPKLQRVSDDSQLDPKQVVGVARWRVWSDATIASDSPIGYYTKAHWDRFPKSLTSR